MEEIARLFLSYRSADARGVARGLATHFKNAGAQIYYDERDIQPGDEWRKDIDAVVARGYLSLLLLNPPHAGGTWQSRNKVYALAQRQRGWRLLYNRPEFRHAVIHGVNWTTERVLEEIGQNIIPRDLSEDQVALISHSLGGLVVASHGMLPWELMSGPSQFGLRPAGETQPGRKEPKEAQPTDVTLEFDADMSDEDVEKFLAHFREAAKEVSGKEPQIVELAGDE